MRYALCLATACIAAAAQAAAPPKRETTAGKPADVFGLTKLWSMHLTIQPDDWEKMQPTRGGFGRPGPVDKTKPDTADRKARGGFGFDFEYVKGEVSIGGAVLKDIGIRFKGNSSYSQMPGLKKPFRLDFDRYAPGQSFKGVTKVSLNNHVLDTTGCRENLAFAVYRAAGVPAPRTAYAELYLTVPGKYDRELLGFYSMIEGIDKPFLKDRFGSSKGVVYKPERVGPLDYLGEDWAEYESRYRPRPKTDAKTNKRLIDLCWLVSQSDDRKFAAEIAEHLDLDNALRYFACTVALASLDSFIGLGHNYYLYLNPKTDRFAFVPWDTDHSFGALSLVGSSSKLADLSIRRPHAGRNKLVDRILADPKHYAAYSAHLRKILAGRYTDSAVKADMAAVAAFADPIRRREKESADRRKEPKVNLLALMFGASTDLPGFVTKRTASIESQLAGQGKGAEVDFTWFGFKDVPAWLALARPALDAGGKQGALTKAEAADAVRTLFAACDVGKKGRLDEKSLALALTKVLPKPYNRSGSRDLPATLARTLILKAGKDGSISADALAGLALSSFDRADRDRSGKLDERELAESLRTFLPAAPPPFGAPPPPPKKEDRR